MAIHSSVKMALLRGVEQRNRRVNPNMEVNRICNRDPTTFGRRGSAQRRAVTTWWAHVRRYDARRYLRLLECYMIQPSENTMAWVRTELENEAGGD